MRNSLTKIASSVLLCSATALASLGTVSCNKNVEPEPVIENQLVEHAYIRTALSSGGLVTKATITEREAEDGKTHRYLKFQGGDMLVMASGGYVSGTLRCVGPDPDPSNPGNMLFEGEAYNFDPSDVNFFYLGETGVSVGTSSVTVDFSSQNGALDKIEQDFSFVKIMGAKFVKDPDNEDNYIQDMSKVPVASAIEGIKFINVTIDNLPDSPMSESGVWPKKVSIDGLKNQMKLDLLTGEFTAVNKDEATPTVITPSSNAYASNYWLAALPQQSENLSITVDFSDGAVTQKTWSGFSWNIDENYDGTYETEWAGKGLTEFYFSTKAGYNGVDIGEDVDEGGSSESNKPGYGGSAVEGSDDLSVNKPGYGGSDVN